MYGIGDIDLMTLAQHAWEDWIVQQVAVSPDDPLVHFYGDKLRASLFSGFLTLGGFLLSVKTFVVVQMKTGLYDTDGYRKRVVAARQLKPETPYYKPLANFSRALFWAVLLALVTAAAQLTIGFYESRITVYICLGLAILTLIVLAVVLALVQSNLKSWFTHMEKAVEHVGRKKKARPNEAAEEQPPR